MERVEAMHSAIPTQARVAYERRRRAAWIDYLRATQSSAPESYAGVEPNAWELLQRRLRRNDELLLDALG